MNRAVASGSFAIQPKGSVAVPVVTLKLTPELIQQLSAGSVRATLRLGVDDDDPCTFHVNDNSYEMKYFPEKSGEKVGDVYRQRGARGPFTYVGLIDSKLQVKANSTTAVGARVRQKIDLLESAKSAHKVELLSPRASNLAVRKATPNARGTPNRLATAAPARPVTAAATPVAKRVPAVAPVVSDPRAARKRKADDELAGEAKRPRISPIPAHPLAAAPRAVTATTNSGSPPGGPSTPASVREQMIHQLAVEPGLLFKQIRMPFGASKEQVTTALKDVANYMAPGRYSLKTENFKKVRLDGPDAWPYTPEDREKARKRVREVLGADAPSPAPTTPSVMESPSGSTRTVVDVDVEAPFPSNESAIILGDALEMDLDIDPTFSDWPTIQTQEQYDLYRSTFEEKHKLYFAIDKELAANSMLFKRLGEQLEQAENDDERTSLEERIGALFDRRADTKRKMEKEYKKLHALLRHLKSEANAYVGRHQGK